MESMDYWRLCDELSVVQAALLIVGTDPAVCQENILGWAPWERASGFDAAFAALRNSINKSSLKAMVRHRARDRIWREELEPGQEIMDVDERMDTDERERRVFYKVDPDWHLTTIAVSDLREWLFKRGIRTGFFFPDAVDTAEYLDSTNPRYAPKLAASVQAWMAVRDTNGKSPKQALEKWLREHAVEFDLTLDDGSPNNTGIEDAAKVANWQLGGGAPKTPS